MTHSGAAIAGSGDSARLQWQAQDCNGRAWGLQRHTQGLQWHTRGLQWHARGLQCCNGRAWGLQWQGVGAAMAERGGCNGTLGGCNGRPRAAMARRGGCNGSAWDCNGKPLGLGGLQSRLLPTVWWVFRACHGRVPVGLLEATAHGMVAFPAVQWQARMRVKIVAAHGMVDFFLTFYPPLPSPSPPVDFEGGGWVSAVWAPGWGGKGGGRRKH